MKLTDKIGWVSLNTLSKKLFEFDLKIFCHFKDHFFKALATDIMVDGLPLMFNRDREPRFPFYRQFDPTRFKYFDEDLLTLVERVDKVILEQLPTLLGVWAILSLPSADDPFAILDGKMPYLVLFCVRGRCRPRLTLVVLLLHFGGYYG